MHNYQEYRNLIESRITTYIPRINEYASILQKSMEYSLTVGGKRLRPVLLLAMTEFNGGSIDEALPYACALEYIHTYSLIHDDLPAMDNDTLRRGNPTNHVVFGEDIAILAGDGLLNTAAQIMYQELLKHIDDGLVQNHAKAGHAIITRSGVQGMIGGQVVDVINENSSGTKELVEFIELHKTADLIVAPVAAGLYLTGANESVYNDFINYAVSLGVAFQILDDILDMEGDEELVGKTLGKDAEQNKCNYVCVHGLNDAKAELHRLTVKAIDSVKKYGDKADFFIKLAESLEIRDK